VLPVCALLPPPVRSVAGGELVGFVRADAWEAPRWQVSLHCRFFALWESSFGVVGVRCLVDGGRCVCGWFWCGCPVCCRLVSVALLPVSVCAPELVRFYYSTVRTFMRRSCLGLSWPRTCWQTVVCVSARIRVSSAVAGCCVVVVVLVSGGSSPSLAVWVRWVRWRAVPVASVFVCFVPWVCLSVLLCCFPACVVSRAVRCVRWFRLVRCYPVVGGVGGLCPFWLFGIAVCSVRVRGCVARLCLAPSSCALRGWR
jgi:hypothetical protein